jgi:hypothetical protein
VWLEQYVPWLAGWPPGRLADCWLAGWLAAWPAGWLLPADRWLAAAFNITACSHAAMQ